MSAAKITEAVGAMQACVETMGLCADLFGALVVSRGALSESQKDSIAEAGKRLMDEAANVLDCARADLACITQDATEALS